MKGHSLVTATGTVRVVTQGEYVLLIDRQQEQTIVELEKQVDQMIKYHAQVQHDGEVNKLALKNYNTKTNSLYSRENAEQVYKKCVEDAATTLK